MGANKIYPGQAGGEVTIPASGSVVVDTGLRELDYANVSLAQDAVATAASLSWERVARVAGDLTAKIRIKSWAADGFTAGSTAAKASWSAFAK